MTPCRVCGLPIAFRHPYGWCHAVPYIVTQRLPRHRAMPTKAAVR